MCNNNYIYIFVICGKLNIQPGIGVQEVWFHYTVAITVIYHFKNCATFYWGEFQYFQFSIWSKFVSPGIGNFGFLPVCLIIF